MGAQTHGHTHGHAHGGHRHEHGGHDHLTHDGIDWSTRIGHLRREDAVAAEASAGIAARLVGGLPAGATIVDIGSGTGGQAAAFATALAARGGGRVVLVDAVPELLTAAEEAVHTALGGGVAAESVHVDKVHADAAADELLDRVPVADLVWAARAVHHLPDEQAGVHRLARLVRAGGYLALAEGGLATRYLPWDLGLGEPGLQDRLNAARDIWFARMRADMPGSVRMPYGWGVALAKAGMAEVTSFSVLTDHPAPAAPAVREAVVEWLSMMSERMDEELSESDRDALRALLDPAADTYVGRRDDTFLLSAATVHVGRRG
ncbi:class I SAM-dependent methyltransferase [Nocardia otitidiscaviarum]|uniref:class I SAM-dependent methyltransferase n=1 Tax=Nocardia otitidiscaviarum TaxID=1823 RepID=UPI0009E082FA|nr:class I SAM-dependent methyltransferase [Nocardia otitidiscaviarum]MBF6135759.1 class I SAM-dependent methyltransferase [Nocardia otitidiscaviarum]MBF6483572.1 class I SAM-dependent methyltransferase [Nocardia otitidiscaviarum]